MIRLHCNLSIGFLDTRMQGHAWGVWTHHSPIFSFLVQLKAKSSNLYISKPIWKILQLLSNYNNLQTIRSLFHVSKLIGLR